MTPGRGDWLDALARRSAGRGIRTARTPEGDAPPPSEGRFSRSTALKLALAGVTSLSLGGLWKASPALAQDRGGCFTPALAQDRGACFTKCLDCHDKELKRRLQSCNDVFRPKQYRTNDWRLYANALFPPKASINVAGLSLAGLCYAKAKWEVGGDKNDCYEGCEDTCRKRSLQSSSGRSSATCEVTPPPKAPPPTIPPPPDPAEDLCLTCGQVGGLCCGSCPRNPEEKPCVTLLTDGTPAQDCKEVIAACS